MTNNLQQEIGQTKPFASVEIEAVLSIMRTAAILDNELAETLKPFDLTPTQYNVLRILRGAGESGLCRYEVADRLITPGPDVTRLLGRLVKAGYVSRSRDPEDRRQVLSRITTSGLNLLEELDEVLGDLHEEQIGHLEEEQLRKLIDLLSAARTR